MEKMAVKLKIGIEAEGKFKGLKTLFVYDNVNLTKIIKKHKIQHVYFDATKMDININIVKKLQKLGVIISIQIDTYYWYNLIKKWLKNVNIVYVIDFPPIDFMTDFDIIKIEGKDTICATTKELCFKTDKRVDYKDDKVIL